MEEQEKQLQEKEKSRIRKMMVYRGGLSTECLAFDLMETGFGYPLENEIEVAKHNVQMERLFYIVGQDPAKIEHIVNEVARLALSI